MKSTGESPTSRPKAQMMEWQVCENEREWQAAQYQTGEGLVLAAQTQQRTRRWLLRWRTPSVLIVLVLALSGAWWLWGLAQRGLDEIETEVEAAVIAELWSVTPEHNPSEVVLQELSLLNTMRLPGDAGEVVPDIKILELDTDWAVIDVLIQPTAAGPTYRQTRVYRYSDHGWIRAKVTAERWGRVRQLESDYFVFYYRTLDEEAVTQAAARLDSLYPLLYSSFFADGATGEKKVIVIDPEWRIGDLPQQTTPPDALMVASPAATLRPAELAVGDILLQSIMLALFDDLAGQATEYYKLSSESLLLYSGLRLWLIWEHELPLAVWRKPLVKWVFRDAEVAVGPTAFAIPTFAYDLCVHHSLWMHSPLSIAVPVLCWRSSKGEEKIVAWRYYDLPIELPSTSLMYIHAQTNDSSQWQDEPLPEPMAAGVGLATVFEYIASTYGAERIPLLLAGLRHHEQEETLIPAVFGLPQADFNRDWQAFLAERYGITP